MWAVLNGTTQEMFVPRGSGSISKTRGLDNQRRAASVSPSSAVATVQTADDEKLWSREATFFLITQVQEAGEEFENGLKKNVWSRIAANCSGSLAKNFSSKQVETKWKTLKRTYKSILNHNKSTGRNRRYWEYFDVIHTVMHSMPEITPVATCSSAEGLKVAAQTQAASDTPRSATTTEDDLENPSSFLKKRKRKDSDIERRHREKIERWDRFNDLFEKYINKL